MHGTGDTRQYDNNQNTQSLQQSTITNKQSGGNSKKATNIICDKLNHKISSYSY